MTNKMKKIERAVSAVESVATIINGIKVLATIAVVAIGAYGVWKITHMGAAIVESTVNAAGEVVDTAITASSDAVGSVRDTVGDIDVAATAETVDGALDNAAVWLGDKVGTFRAAASSDEPTDTIETPNQ